MVILFAFIVSIGLVAAKLRAECGVPYSHYFPQRVMLFASLLGGMALFGPRGYLFALLASYIICATVFFM